MSLEEIQSEDIFSQKLLNSGFLATKSVSEFISTIEDLVPEVKIVIKPSEAPRSDFFAAFAIPFFLKNSIAKSISSLFSDNAILQSCIPAPVISLKSLTFSKILIKKLVYCFFLIFYF